MIGNYFICIYVLYVSSNSNIPLSWFCKLEIIDKTYKLLSGKHIRADILLHDDRTGEGEISKCYGRN